MEAVDVWRGRRNTRPRRLRHSWSHERAFFWQQALERSLRRMVRCASGRARKWCCPPPSDSASVEICAVISVVRLGELRVRGPDGVPAELARGRRPHSVGVRSRIVSRRRETGGERDGETSEGLHARSLYFPASPYVAESENSEFAGFAAHAAHACMYRLIDLGPRQALHRLGQRLPTIHLICPVVNASCPPQACKDAPDKPSTTAHKRPIFHRDQHEIHKADQGPKSIAG